MIGLFDILLFQILVGGMALGMFRGFLRQAISVVVLYIAVVLSAMSYGWFATRIGGMAGNPDALSGSAAFLMLLALLAAGLEATIQKTYAKLEWKWLGGLNQLGGMMGGFLWAAVCTTFILMALNFAVTAGDWGPWEGARRLLFSTTENSALVAIYRNAFPVFANAIRPFFPGGLPPLFVPPPI
jgi:uncharacterized membrane protein required for colicin V production